LPAVAEGAFRLLADIAAAHHALGQKLCASPAALSRVVAEVRRHRDALVYPGFFQATPWPSSAHLPRYLTALDHRLVKYPQNPTRDARHSAVVESFWERYRERREAIARELRPGARAFPLVVGGAFRFAVCAGVEDSVSGVGQAPGKGLGGALPLTVVRRCASWLRLLPDRVS
jgi:hypothetical protein